MPPKPTWTTSKTMSSLNRDGDEVINFDDFNDMSEIKMVTIGACKDNVASSELIQDLMADELVVIVGDDYENGEFKSSASSTISVSSSK